MWFKCEASIRGLVNFHVIKLLVNCVKCIESSKQQQQKSSKKPKRKRWVHQCGAFQWQGSKDRRARDRLLFFQCCNPGLCTHNTHTLYLCRRPQATAAKSGCVSQFKKERRKKIRGFSGLEPILSVKSIISLRHARNLYRFFLSF